MIYGELKTFVDAAKKEYQENGVVTFQGLVDRGVKSHTIHELRLDHIVGGKDDKLFIAWHNNKFYPEATVDMKMNALKPHDFSDVYKIIEDISKDDTKENELVNMFRLRKALDNEVFF